MSSAQTDSCPDPPQLREYLLGNLDDDTSSSIDTHLTVCVSCEETVQSLEAEIDFPASPPNKSRARSGPKADETCTNAMIGRRLRQYTLLEEIGRGGMGMVYRAKQELLGREVAVKILPESSLRRADLVERFLREMQAVGKLQHPNIVIAYDAGEVDGIHFLAMELINGPDLRSLVQRIGLVSVADACELTRQSAVALQAAHDRGLVHRDVKPSNLLLSETGNVKLLDLGLALLIHDQSEDLTHAGQVMGTLDFMAPEQATDTHAVDHRADIYSLACTLYFLLTGRAPYAASVGPQRKLMAHASAPIPSVLNQRKDVPAELAELTAQMMAKDPNQRPPLTQVAERLSLAASRANPVALRRLFNLPTSASDAKRKRKHEVADVTIDSVPAAIETQVTAPSNKRGLSWQLSIAIALVVLVAAGYPLWSNVVSPWMNSKTEDLASQDFEGNSTPDDSDDLEIPPIEHGRQVASDARELYRGEVELGTLKHPYVVSQAGDGTHESIAAALKAADEDENEVSFIQVQAGLYDEALKINSSVTIVGTVPPVDDDGGEFAGPSHSFTRIRGKADSPIKIAADLPAQSSITLTNLVIFDESDDASPFNTVDLEGGANVVIDHCKVTAGKQNGIKVKNGTALTVTSCLVEGITDQFAISTKGHGDLTIRECKFPKHGIQINHGTGTIVGCEFRGARGIEIADAEQPVLIENCDFFTSSRGLEILRSSKVELIGGEFRGCEVGAEVGTQIEPTKNELIVEDCTWTDCLDAAVWVHEQGSIVSSRNCLIVGGQRGILIESGNATLKDFAIEGCSRGGILMFGGSLHLDGKQISECAERSIYVGSTEIEPAIGVIRNLKVIGGMDGLVAVGGGSNSPLTKVEIFGSEFLQQSSACCYASGHVQIEYQDTDFVPKAPGVKLLPEDSAVIQPKALSKTIAPTESGD